MTDLRAYLVQNHGEDVVRCYESHFPNELELFNERFCGCVILEPWAQDCLDSCYDGFDDDQIPCLESFIEMEFYHYYVYDEYLKIGFKIT